MRLLNAFKSAMVIATLLALVSVGGCTTVTNNSGTSQPTSTPIQRPDKSKSKDRTQEEVLNDYVDAVREQSSNFIDQFEGVYSDFDVRGIAPSTVEYEYVYAMQVNSVASKVELKKQKPTIKSMCKTLLFPEMKREGITKNPKIRFIYLNADRTKIWSYTCK